MTEVDDGAILVERVADLPAPHVTSSQRTCDYCGAAVWVDLKLLAIADAPGITVTCTHCIAREEGL